MQLTITIDSDDLKPLLTEIVQQVLAGTSSTAKKPTQEVAAESIGVSEGTPSTPARTQGRQDRVTLGPSPELTGSDKEHGYQFGCDGLMDVAAVMKHLAMSRSTVARKIKADVLRSGKDPDTKSVRICRRSVMEYVAAILT